MDFKKRFPFTVRYFSSSRSFNFFIIAKKRVETNNTTYNFIVILFSFLNVSQIGSLNSDIWIYRNISIGRSVHVVTVNVQILKHYIIIVYQFIVICHI